MNYRGRRVTEPPVYVCVWDLLCLCSSVEVRNVISPAKESRNTKDRYCQRSFAMLLNYLLNKCFKNISDWRHGCVLCSCIFWIYFCLFFLSVAWVIEQSRFTDCLDGTNLGGSTSVSVTWSWKTGWMNDLNCMGCSSVKRNTNSTFG